jgi:hypothetical protein
MRYENNLNQINMIEKLYPTCSPHDTFSKINELCDAVNDIKAWQATVSSVKTKPSESHERQFGGEKWYCSDCCEHPMRDTTCECNCHRMRARRINDTVVAPSVQVPPVEPLEAKMTMSEVSIMFTLEEWRVYGAKHGYHTDIPPGVSQWREMGKRYHYDDYFHIVWPDDIRTKDNKIVE